MVFLYTKCDLPAELCLDQASLDAQLNPDGAPSFRCSALRGVGVLEGLQAAIVRVMHGLGPTDAAGRAP